MHRVRVLARLLTGAVTVATLLLAPIAWASDDVSDAPLTERLAATAVAPLPLAQDELGIAIPTVIGLAVLLIGTTLVAWAVLRGSRPGRSRR